VDTPLFLDLEQVLRLHHSLIERYGGLDGTRDTALLQSTIAMPQMSFGRHYLHQDLFDMEIDNDEDGLVELTLSVAQGQSGKTEIAEFFRSRVL
jgi:prophage maintenance system killer protein